MHVQVGVWLSYRLCVLVPLFSSEQRLVSLVPFLEGSPSHLNLLPHTHTMAILPFRAGCSAYPVSTQFSVSDWNQSWSCVHDEQAGLWVHVGGGVRGWAGKESWQESWVLWSVAAWEMSQPKGIVLNSKEGPRNPKPRSWDSACNVTSVFHIPDSGNSSVYFWW